MQLSCPGDGKQASTARPSRGPWPGRKPSFADGPGAQTSTGSQRCRITETRGADLRFYWGKGLCHGPHFTFGAGGWLGTCRISGMRRIILTEHPAAPAGAVGASSELASSKRVREKQVFTPGEQAEGDWSPFSPPTGHEWDHRLAHDRRRSCAADRRGWPARTTPESDSVVRYAPGPCTRRPGQPQQFAAHQLAEDRARRGCPARR